MTGIYRIIHIDSGRCYVGQSVNIAKRWSSHRAALNQGKHTTIYLQRVWTKYGQGAFAFEIIELCEVQYLTAREQAAMDRFRPEFNAAPAAGSNLGMKHSVEARAKISAGNRGQKRSEEFCAKMRMLNLGKVLTPQHKARISAAKIGFRPSTEARAKMRAARLGGTHSAETRAKIAAAKLGTKRGPHSETTKAKMCMAQKARRANESNFFRAS